MARPAYDAWRMLVKKQGGKMEYERKGRPQWGAWVIRMGSKTYVIPSSGKASFLELDQCYEPKVADPKSYYDYRGENSFMEECARLKLRAWLGE